MCNHVKGQDTLMKFDPASGRDPYPTHAGQWRKYYPKRAWLWNPWTGNRRAASDVCTDVFGLLIVPPGEVLTPSDSGSAGYAASGLICGSCHKWLGLTVGNDTPACNCGDCYDQEWMLLADFIKREKLA